MCFAPQQRALFRDLNFQKWSEPLVLLTFWLPNVLRATSACTFSTSQLPKVLRPWCVLCILTSKCASRHTGVHFWHRNFQKRSDAEVFCTFWLESVLRATTACTFSTSQLPKVVRHWGVLCILTSKCASCHNGVRFFHISTSKSRPTLRCFVHFDLEMCNFSSLIWPAGSAPAALASLLFDPPEPQIIGKTQCFATFLPFRASASSFFLLFFLLIFLFSLPLPCSAFHLSILSEVWLLNFLRWLCIYIILYYIILYYIILHYIILYYIIILYNIYIIYI